MAKSERKSMSYYALLICIILMGVTYVYAFIWRPSFSEGYISIPFADGVLSFPSWKFISASLAFAVFVYLAFKIFKGNSKNQTLILANIAGIITIGLCFTLLREFIYFGSSYDMLYKDHLTIYYTRPFWILIVVIITTLLFLFLNNRENCNRYSRYYISITVIKTCV